jgi:hypothetical protein
MRAIHAEGAMAASQTVLPFKLAASDKSLRANSGLTLFGEYLHAMGVCGLIDHELAGPGSAAGYRRSVHVLPLVLILAGCGRTLEDLRVVRNDAGVRWRLFQTAAKIVRHGGQLFLKISAATLEMFAAIRESCAQIIQKGGAIAKTS